MSTKTTAVISAQPTPATQQPPTPYEHVMQLAAGFLPAACISLVARLGIADLIHSGKRSAHALAEATHTNEDALYRVMRTLSGFGVFHENGNREFSLTPAGEVLRSDVEGSARGMIGFFADPFHFKVYAEMLHSVQTGKSAVEKVLGVDCFQALERDPEELHWFQSAMTSQTIVQMPTILEAYDFTRFHKIVEIAGGHGYLLNAILSEYPHLHGVLFDQASVIELAREKLMQNGTASRIEYVVGDFFKAIPEGGDCYTMKHIIHDWDDPEAITILRNCRRAIGENDDARVLIVDYVVPENGAPHGPAPHASKIVDIEMLVMPGGRERTEKEFRKLLTNSGFRLNRIVPTKSGLSIVEGAPE